MKLEALLYSRGAVHITRYHNTPTRRESNVAEHSYGVANIVLFLTRGSASANLLKAALHHDIAEIATGDLPAPVKSGNPEVKAAVDALEAALNGELGIMQDALTSDEGKVLKFADRYEGLLYTMEEYDMGNALILPILKKWVSYLWEQSLADTFEGKQLMSHYHSWAITREIL